ncbi:MAG: F420-dependent NADP oxidoreductase, partial [Alphaproteobacteria bacterium]|nr:F420-dependent NADP oxidoreductase [Alphaproteobacteria bacterium]
MRIGIIGSGNMGRAIGVALARLGHPVRFGA